ncbi:E3 ubiquitin-protein ligase RNF220-like [Hyperolius riggenbachi]|uniref:E3 ubiquitin-protein ligase RNF220-like n=1 Tax=Hyperolius riggenbachi TaxID=752182 RepID=UPI0035A34871
MESTPGLINPLTSQALLVMATSSDGPLGLVQQPPHYSVPMAMDKPPQIPYLSPAYPLLYPPQDHLNSACASQILSLSHQYGHPRPGVGVLGYSTLHPFATFRLPESVERLQAGFLNPKRMKGESEPPQIHYLPVETGLEAPHLSPGPIIPPVSHRGSPKPRTSSSSKKERKTPLAGPLLCPMCHKHLLKEELPHHLHYEMEQLCHLSDSEPDIIPEASQSNSQSPLPGRDSRSDSPLMTSEDGQKLDRQQVFQQIRWNREERMGARIGKCKRVRGNAQEVSTFPSIRNGETSEEIRWEDEARSPEKVPYQQTECRASPGSSMSSHSEESDSDETPSSSRAKEGTLESLRDKIQELTEKLRNTHTCHICLDAYSLPVTSIQCWHIHCEACWLRALGTKKLCPQCNTITSPSDLRRVYL